MPARYNEGMKSEKEKEKEALEKAEREMRKALEKFGL